MHFSNYTNKTDKKCTALVKSYIERQKNNSSVKEPEDMKSVVIDMLVDVMSAKGHVVPTAEQLTEEVIMLLSAGNDTTSDALIIGIWQICRHPKVLQLLEDELYREFPSVENTSSITYENVRSLPYLVSSMEQI
jgi:cytochrome P450